MFELGAELTISWRCYFFLIPCAAYRTIDIEVILYDVLTTSEFGAWLEEQPPKTKIIVKARLDLVAIGHFGDHKRFEGLIELRWKNGNRIYSFMWGNSIVVALYGGNKNGQSKDIKKAKKIRDEVLEGSRTLHE